LTYNLLEDYFRRLV